MIYMFQFTSPAFFIQDCLSLFWGVWSCLQPGSEHRQAPGASRFHVFLLRSQGVGSEERLRTVGAGRDACASHPGTRKTEEQQGGDPGDGWRLPEMFISNNYVCLLVWSHENVILMSMYYVERLIFFQVKSFGERTWQPFARTARLFGSGEPFWSAQVLSHLPRDSKQWSGRGILCP